MRKLVAALAVSTGLMIAGGSAAVAQADPPRGSCNAGTMNAHATVPHGDAPGHAVAHAAIPHCH